MCNDKSKILPRALTIKMYLHGDDVYQNNDRNHLKKCCYKIEAVKKQSHIVDIALKNKKYQIVHANLAIK